MVVSSSECMRAKVLGSVKSPILELVTNLVDLHKEMRLSRATKKLEDAAQAQAKMAEKTDSKLTLVRPQVPDAPVQMKNFLEIMLQKRLHECNVNIVAMDKLDLFSLFNSLTANFQRKLFSQPKSVWTGHFSITHSWWHLLVSIAFVAQTASMHAPRCLSSHISLLKSVTLSY